MLPVSLRYSNYLLGVWWVVFLFQVACTSTFAEPTFEAMSAEIESPIEACPNISGSYEFIGTPLPGMPPTWRGAAKRDYWGNPVEVWKLAFDNFTLFRLYKDKQLENRETITEVEIIQDQAIQLRFKGPFSQEIVGLPEHPDDRLGCSKGKIILLKTRESFGESVTGTVVLKSTYFKNTDESLHVTLQSVSYDRSLFFFWTHEELHGARFAPRQ